MRRVFARVGDGVEGVPCQLLVPGRRGGDFDVVSLGADNLPGGSGTGSDLDQGSRVPD